jgi:hypothetical protein
MRDFVIIKFFTRFPIWIIIKIFVRILLLDSRDGVVAVRDKLMAPNHRTLH